MHAPDSLTVKQPSTDIVEDKQPDQDPELAIVESLCQFAYAFSSIQRLSGGLANATYRGTLCQQLPDGARTIVIKHGKEKSVEYSDVTLSTNRCLTEQALFRILDNNTLGQLKPHKQISIRTPRLYQYYPQSKTQVVEDFANNGTLHKFLSSSAVTGDLSLSTAVALGEALGKWISRLHSWSQSCVDPEVLEIIRKNTDSTERDILMLKYGEVERQCAVEKARRYAANGLFERGQNDIIVHGDFSTRKWNSILVQNPASVVVPEPPNTSSTIAISLAVVDWEVCCYADRTRDLVNMVSDLYMHYHFSHVDAALAILQSFVHAYPPLDEKARYRLVAATGEHFFLWWAYVPDTYTKEQGEEIMALGVDLIVMGNERNCEGIKKTFLGFLFT